MDNGIKMSIDTFEIAVHFSVRPSVSDFLSHDPIELGHVLNRRSVSEVCKRYSINRRFGNWFA